MADRSMTTTKRKHTGLPIRHVSDVRAPDLFRMDMDRLFDDFFAGFGAGPLSVWGSDPDSFSPRIDMTEDEKAVHINAELPGMDEKDIDINLTGDSITISGEKREETEHTDDGCYCSERTYGSFRRVLPVEDVDLDKAHAVFRKGVLNITLPKLEGSGRSSRKIEIKNH
ncbi:MAG TPA: Hsp20/alpha crystallin family protein [Deltaproteobacteria bacterium]|nr:Hsp20/alpha crystallin family protein [Deltaproteobacteria bacterium]HPR56437.1 Hsp20/alpha crystallin family protein [Deltaproteobacteria bacterium]HXK48418.1 Hsp20/alpha crystallin family protein [Deltaproteobacteria bacterium]